MLLRRLIRHALITTLACAAAALGAGAAIVPESSAPPQVRQINLQHGYERALPHATAGAISGIVYARGKQPRAAAAAGSGAAGASCAEPQCPLVYNGGPVQHTPHVYLLLWGPAWRTDPAQQASAAYLESFYKGLGVQPQDHWSTITTQYGDTSGRPSFAASLFAGTWQDTGTPPAGVTQNQLNAEADAFTTSKGITDLTDAQVVVATQSGTCPDGFAAPCNGANGYYCAWHDASGGGETVTNLPYLLDAGGNCGENDVRGQYDGFSIVGGHEYAETITDPVPDSGWIDLSDSSGGEIGDKCAWTGLGTVTLSTGPFAMQSLFSNRAYGSTGTGCVLTAPNGGPITGYGGKCADDWGAQTTNGNKIDIYTCNGTAAQQWTLGTDATLRVVGKCLDDRAYGGSGTKLILYTCTGGSNQRWTHLSNGEYVLAYNHLCLDDAAYSTVNGTQLIIYGCKDSANQRWSLP